MKLENPPDEFYILLLKTSDASRCAVTVHDAVTDGRMILAFGSPNQALLWGHRHGGCYETARVGYDALREDQRKPHGANGVVFVDEDGCFPRWWA